MHALLLDKSSQMQFLEVNSKHFPYPYSKLLSWQKEVLKTWHEQDPANDEEFIRTWQIAFYQQNKPNPFILDETLIERAYFYDGILIGDLNEDGLLNILDLVVLINIILYDEGGSPAADVNGDGVYNVLDVVMLASIILSQN